MSHATRYAPSPRGFGSRFSKARIVAGFFALTALLLPGTGLAEPSYGVAVSASLWADFEASATEDTDRPDLIGGSNNALVTAVWLEQSNVSESFHEVYEGLGESGTSLFEVDFYGRADLASGGDLRVDILGFDQKNATAASKWSASGGAGHYQWMEFSGPTDTNGNYVIGFTTKLGPFTAQNKQPPGFTYYWKANASTTLVAEPENTSFPALELGTSVQLKDGCPTLAGAPCWSIPWTKSATGQVTVPGSNPVLRLSHSLGVTVRSAQASAGGASLSMELPPGVHYTAYQPVPEPSLALLQCAALAGLAGIRAVRRHSGRLS